MRYYEATDYNRWAETNGILKTTPNNNVICRRADNNEKIKQDSGNTEYIGTWAIGGATEEGNGNQIDQTCKAHDLVRIATYFKPQEENKISGNTEQL